MFVFAAQVLPPKVTSVPSPYGSVLTHATGAAEVVPPSAPT